LAAAADDRRVFRRGEHAGTGQPAHELVGLDVVDVGVAGEEDFDVFEAKTERLDVASQAGHADFESTVDEDVPDGVVRRNSAMLFVPT